MITFPTIELDALPAVTAEQMREVDRLMIEDLQIDLPRMMENAGASLATLAIHAFGPRSVCVLAGPGGNGGGGLTAARHLANRGVEVTVVPSDDEARFAPVPRQQLDILRRMDLDLVGEPSPADLVIDALIGYSLHGPPRGRAAELILWANTTGDPVLSLDVPSGLDATTGEATEPTVPIPSGVSLAMWLQLWLTERENAHQECMCLGRHVRRQSLGLVPLPGDLLDEWELVNLVSETVGHRSQRRPVP